MVLFDIANQNVNSWILPLVIVCLFILPTVINIYTSPKASDKVIHTIGLLFLVLLSYVLYDLSDIYRFQNDEKILETRGKVSDIQRPKFFQTIGYFNVGDEKFTFYRFDPLGRFSNKCPKCLDNVEGEVIISHQNNIITKIIVESK